LATNFSRGPGKLRGGWS